MLTDYVVSGSERAFQELVARYLDLVYSTALRLVEGDTHRARDVAQTVFVDLGCPHEIFAVVLWHAHNAPKVCHDVLVGLADEPDFRGKVKTFFNNDRDNSSGLGAGKDREYFETCEGKLLDAKGAAGRSLRFYSKGSTESALNEYTEIEVYGRPAEPPPANENAGKGFIETQENNVNPGLESRTAGP